MRVISNKDSDLLSQIDNINQNDIPLLERLINLPLRNLDIPHQKLSINNQTDAIESKIRNLKFRRYLWILEKF